jgi:hypothetical protein
MEAGPMTCPYLTEITMVYCQASPVRKLIPSDRISTASRCEADGYRQCPLYREALDRTLHAIDDQGHAEREPGGATPADSPGEKGEPT